MFSLLPFVLLLASQHASALPPAVNSSEPLDPSTVVLNLPLVNATELGVDPRFSIDYQVGTERINGLSCSMNTIRFLGVLALNDYNKNIQDAESVSQAPWNDISIALAPLSGPQPRRFFIWGLYQALYYLSQHTFALSAFYLKYDNRQVGVITYTRPPVTEGVFPLTLNGTAGTIPTNASSTPVDVTPKADFEEEEEEEIETTAPANRRTIVSVSYLPQPKTLPIQGVFLALAGAMQHLAESASTARLAPFTIFPDDWNVLVNFEGSRKGLPVPKPAFPVNEEGFTVARGLVSVWEVAKFVVGARRFAECVAIVVVDGGRVGKVEVLQKRTGDPIPLEIS